MKKSTPWEFRVIPVGAPRRAAVARVPSAEKPEGPVPATVRIVPGTGNCCANSRAVPHDATSVRAATEKREPDRIRILLSRGSATQAATDRPTARALEDAPRGARRSVE